MMPLISIIDKYEGLTRIGCGLRVSREGVTFPVLVGCSLRTAHDEIIDVPARWLTEAGLVMWWVEIDRRFDVGSLPHDRVGAIIFALYADNVFAVRTADTGWVSWQARNLIGSSLAPFKYGPERAESISKFRTDVWLPSD